MRRLFTAASAATLLACSFFLSTATARAETFAPINATAQTKSLGRGVNVLGYDPVWRDPAKARFTPRHFKLIHEAGFQTVRIVLQSFEFIDDQGRFDPQWLATLDIMVKAALEQKLNVILDEHDFLICAKELATCKTKLHAFWSQIAPRYKDAPNRVLFEILNEPHDALTDEAWNALAQETLTLIRSSNPERNIIIGGARWNGMEGLPALKLPEQDKHIIVTFHYYHPMAFTHQGAPWADKEIERLSNIAWGNEADYALLNKELDTVKAWSDANGRPIFLGEFGAYEKAPMQYRVTWDAAVARAAEARGFAWAYWQFDPDFILYDISNDKWVEPILGALIPKN